MDGSEGFVCVFVSRYFGTSLTLCFARFFLTAWKQNRHKTYVFLLFMNTVEIIIKASGNGKKTLPVTVINLEHFQHTSGEYTCIQLL